MIFDNEKMADEKFNNNQKFYLRFRLNQISYFERKSAFYIYIAVVLSNIVCFYFIFDALSKNPEFNDELKL